MKPDRRFTQLDKRFWANVRSISEKLGYTARRTKKIKVYDLDEVLFGYEVVERLPQIVRGWVEELATGS